jgi:hypothetical protein
VRVKKPSVGALLLGMIPFIAMCLSVSIWDRVEPMIFGLPFNLFWLIANAEIRNATNQCSCRCEAADFDGVFLTHHAMQIHPSPGRLAKYAL